MAFSGIRNFLMHGVHLLAYKDVTITAPASDPTVTTGAALAVSIADIDIASATALPVVGNVAHDAVDSGNPIKMGGKANSSPPTNVQSGDRVDSWLGLNGSQVISSPISGSGDGASTSFAKIQDPSGNAAYSLSVYPSVYNGSTWDRQRGDTNGTYVAPIYNSSLPTVSNGATKNLQINDRGALRVFVQANTNTATDAVNNGSVTTLTPKDNADVSAPAPLVTAGYVFNGTSWDRLKKPNLAARLLSSAATTNATSVKASAGDLVKIMGNNTVASKRYLKLYNKASAPTVGTDTPVVTLVIPASLPFDFSFGVNGQYFSTGIAYAITGAAADADTTAIGSGDIECLNFTYTG